MRVRHDVHVEFARNGASLGVVVSRRRLERISSCDDDSFYSSGIVNCYHQDKKESNQEILNQKHAPELRVTMIFITNGELQSRAASWAAVETGLPELRPLSEGRQRQPPASSLFL